MIKHATYMLGLLAAIFFSATNSYAQCEPYFEKINVGCINQNSEKFKEDAIEISSTANGPASAINNVYFYETSSGLTGKLKLIAALSNDDECSVLLDIVTYTRAGPVSPYGSATIKKEFGNWSQDRISLEGNGGERDLILTREDDKCVIKTDLAKIALHQKLNEDDSLQGSSLLFYSSLILMFLAALIVARAFFADEDRFKAQEVLEDADQEDRKSLSKDDPLLKFSRPFYKRYFTPIVMGMKNKKSIRERYRRKIASAGLTKVINPEEFYALKLFLVIGFPVLYIVLREVLGTDWPTSFLPGVAVGGFFYPELWLNGKIQRRKSELIKSMPFIVDMLALSVEAGLDFMAAMTKVIEKAPPSPLSEEFEIMIKETRVGASRAEGLRQLSWRTDCLPIASFCATLIAADSVGASIAPILKTLAAELRQKRSAEAEKAGATAATKILFPMMFLIMPAVALIIMAPILLQFLAG